MGLRDTVTVLKNCERENFPSGQLIISKDQITTW